MFPGRSKANILAVALRHCVFLWNASTGGALPSFVRVVVNRSESLFFRVAFFSSRRLSVSVLFPLERRHRRVAHSESLFSESLFFFRVASVGPPSPGTPAPAGHRAARVTCSIHPNPRHSFIRVVPPTSSDPFIYIYIYIYICISDVPPVGGMRIAIRITDGGFGFGFAPKFRVKSHTNHAKWTLALRIRMMM